MYLLHMICDGIEFKICLLYCWHKTPEQVIEFANLSPDIKTKCIVMQKLNLRIKQDVLFETHESNTKTLHTITKYIAP